jgi:hypothetical protein
MLTWTKKYPRCKHPVKSDFSYYPGHTILDEKVPFFYCLTCQTRWHNGKEYNPDQWDEYINE